MKKYTLFYLLVIILSCTAKKQDIQTSAVVDTLAENELKQDTLKPSLTAETSDTVINIKFEKDSIAQSVSGELKRAAQHVIVYVDVKQGKNLFAILHPKDSNANIRFNQIFTPDGKADGPFGKEINKPVLKQGMYKLIIGRNLMADGVSAGKFDLRVIVK